MKSNKKKGWKRPLKRQDYTDIFRLMHGKEYDNMIQRKLMQAIDVNPNDVNPNPSKK